MSSACLVQVNHSKFQKTSFLLSLYQNCTVLFLCFIYCVLYFNLTAAWFVPIPQPNAAAWTSMIGHSENSSWRLQHFHWLTVGKLNPALKFHWFTLSDAFLGECALHERHGVFGMHLGNEKRVQNVSCVPLHLKWALDKTAVLILFSAGAFFYIITSLNIATGVFRSILIPKMDKLMFWCFRHV